MEERIEVLLELIPYGENNAISRADLTAKMVAAGVIEEYRVDKDRIMRATLAKARENCVIVTRPGGGYYRPTKDDAESVKRHFETLKKRARMTFKATSHEGKYVADIERGRL